MKNLYKGLARNSDDIEAALLLAAETFNTSKDLSKEALKNKKILLSPYGSFDENDVVILANDKNEVCGTCFLIDREFYKNNIRIKSTFLSSICISKSFRGLGLSKLLMDEAIKRCEARGSAFAVLIARKSVDFFYNKFSFWGLSQYSKINLKINERPASKLNYSILDITEKDLVLVSEIYNSTYSKLFGSCVRSIKYWKYILWKVKAQQFNFLIIKVKDVVLGYVIFKGNDVYEISSSENTSSLELIYILAERYKIDNFVLHCSSEHPIIPELEDLDFSYIKRQCLFGGHMARVLNADYLLSYLKSELQQVTSTLGISSHKEVAGKSIIEIKDKKLDIKISGSPYTYKNTCFLMMANNLSIFSDKNIVYKPSSFNIPYFDQI